MGNEEIIIRLLFALVFGGICAAIASSKGRSAVGWFLLGFFFSCISLIIILCLSNRKEEEARWEAQNIEQQRLREQLRQEQIKNEALRQHTVARLDQHDQKLGIDTRHTSPALTNTVSPPTNIALSSAEEPGPPTGYPADNWYVDNQGQQDGPYSWIIIYRRAKQGSLTADTRVWADGMADWMPAREIPSLFS